MGEFEKKLRYLEIINTIIARMASNSFSLKGWAVTLASGVLILSAKESNKLFFLIAYFPIITFWFLDSYYLQLERKYRFIYDRVRKMEIAEIEYDVSIDGLSKKDYKKLAYCNCLASGTELMFYIPCALTITVVVLLLKP